MACIMEGKWYLLQAGGPAWSMRRVRSLGLFHMHCTWPQSKHLALSHIITEYNLSCPWDSWQPTIMIPCFLHELCTQMHMNTTIKIVQHGGTCVEILQQVYETPGDRNSNDCNKIKRNKGEYILIGFLKNQREKEKVSPFQHLCKYEPVLGS